MLSLRDAKAMADKKAAKEAEKARRLENDPHGNATREYEEAEKRKMKQKADKKERKLESGQHAKAMRNMEAKAAKK